MRIRDLKAATIAVFALTSTSITAGGGGDATAINGATIALGTLGKRASSVMFCIPCRAVLAAGKKLTVQGKIQESADGSTWTDVASNATILTLLDSGSGSTMTGMAVMGLDVVRENTTHIRIVVTPDLDASGTDTAVIGTGTAVFGGLDVVPGQ